MARTWWLFDARFQCPYRSAEKICMYLEGRNKPLYHPRSNVGDHVVVTSSRHVAMADDWWSTTADVGDHVVVINTRHVAMADDLWRTDRYFHHTRYAGGFSVTTAWQLHEIDPTKVMWKAVNYALPKDLMRKTYLARCHLYPDEEVPDEIMNNVTDVIRQIQVVPKKIEDYSPEEIENFPKLFDWPEDHTLFKKGPMPENPPDPHPPIIKKKRWQPDPLK